MGVFSLFWLWQLVVLSPFFKIFEMGLMTEGLWTSGVTALAFCSPVTLFPQLLHAKSWAGQLFLLGGC